MNSTLLWFNNTNRPLSFKVEEAAEQFRAQHGTEATLCLVNPAMVVDYPPPPLYLGESDAVPIVTDNPEDARLEIRTTNDVLPNHFMLSIDEGDSVPVY